MCQLAFTLYFLRLPGLGRNTESGTISPTNQPSNIFPRISNTFDFELASIAPIRTYIKVIKGPSFSNKCGWTSPKRREDQTGEQERAGFQFTNNSARAMKTKEGDFPFASAWLKVYFLPGYIIGRTLCELVVVLVKWRQPVIHYCKLQTLSSSPTAALSRKTPSSIWQSQNQQPTQNYAQQSKQDLISSSF